MTGDEQWEARHRAARAESVGEVDPFVARALAALGPGDGRVAWDLAAGRGRHTLELARRGWRVVAVDRSAEALAQLAGRACDEELAVETVQADLEAREWWTGLPAPDLALVVNYLDRALLAALPARLAPGGALVAATFTTDRPGDHPSARFCLDPGELARLVPASAVRLAEERDGRAGLLARFGARGD